jgi:2-polyprenyl-3-methyl-5-hydroxy-6-metoxy-1,4-benzoquinol methylase
MYREEYDLAAHFDEFAARKSALFRRRLAEVSVYASVGGRRLCDVGCAGGQFLELARDAGWEPFGVELNPPAAQRARLTGAPVVEGRLEELEDLPWATFDVVTCWDALEHTPDPAAFGKRLAALLRPGGSLFVTTVNWNALVRRVFRMRWSLVAEGHFTYWTERAMKVLFSPLVQVNSVRTFGLGRDFLKPVDVLVCRHRRPEAEVGGDEREPSSWDASGPVLAVEGFANALLGAAGLGVDLYGIFKAPPS